MPENNDFHTPARQAEVLINTLPIVGPLAQVKRRHSRIFVNGEPNTPKVLLYGTLVLGPCPLKRRND